MASRLIRNQLPSRVAGSTPVSSARKPPFLRVFLLFSCPLSQIKSNLFQLGGQCPRSIRAATEIELINFVPLLSLGLG